MLRFCVCNQHATEADIDAAWIIVQKYAHEVRSKQRCLLQNWR